MDGEPLLEVYGHPASRESVIATRLAAVVLAPLAGFVAVGLFVAYARAVPWLADIDPPRPVLALLFGVAALGLAGLAWRFGRLRPGVAYGRVTFLEDRVRFEVTEADTF